MRENCGVFGVYSPMSCSYCIKMGIHALQHRGEQYGGIATYNKNKNSLQLITKPQHVEQSFTKELLEKLEGNLGIGHASAKDPQPFFADCRLGKFALAYNGNIINAQELREELWSQGHSFFTDHDVEILTKLVAQGKDFLEGISRLAEKVKGSFSLVVLTEDGVYAARDPFARKPLIIGENDGKYAVASESRALDYTGLNANIRDLEAGEIVLINKDGFSTVKRLESKKKAHCIFEWGYTASIDSVMEGIPIITARNNAGRALARNDNVGADLVAAVPLSGIGHALGYQEESGLIYKYVFLIDRFLGRSYTPPDQKTRDEIARRKLSTINEVIKGKRIILVDDSIVRGTQIRNKVRELKEAGAREVHVRISCPPLEAPCPYDRATRSYEELATKNFTREGLKKYINADSLKYNTLDDFVDAVTKNSKLTKSDLCLACFGEPVMQ